MILSLQSRISVKAELILVLGSRFCSKDMYFKDNDPKHTAGKDLKKREIFCNDNKNFESN